MTQEQEPIVTKLNHGWVRIDRPEYAADGETIVRWYTHYQRNRKTSQDELNELTK